MISTDEFVQLKEVIEEAVTTAVAEHFGEGWAIVEDYSNEPTQYMEDGDIILPIRIEGLEL